MLKDYLGEQHFKEISEEMGHFIEQMKTLGWKDLKSWNEFFGVFKIPQWNLKHLEQRLTTNFLHYRSNYLVICIIITLMQILFNPLVLLSLICITLFSIYFLILVKKPIVIGDMTINDKSKIYISVIGSILFLAISGALERLLWIIIYCVLVCALHMLFRPRSVTSKTNKVYEELKLSGFSWFGGGSDSPGGFGPAAGDPEDPPQYKDEPQLGMTTASVRKRTAAPVSSNLKPDY